MISQAEKCAFCRLVEKALGDAKTLNMKLKEKLSALASRKSPAKQHLSESFG